MSGTPQESSLSQHDAVNLLLNAQAPEMASEEDQETIAEADAEAPEEEVYEAEAVDEGQAEVEEMEAAEDDDDYEEVEYHRVKVDGEERDVTYEELIKNYQLEQTAQKRLMAVSEEKKSLETEKAQTEQVRIQYEQALNQMAQQLQTANQPKDQAYWADEHFGY
jgi:hypothetical protein